MADAFFKVSKKQLARIIHDAKLVQLWNHILDRANFKPSVVQWTSRNGCIESIQLQPGQMIFGRGSVAKKLHQKDSSNYNRLMKLKTIGYIDTKSMKTCTVVTICNFETKAEKVEADNSGSEQQTKQQREQQAGQQSKHTVEGGKKGKEIKTPPTPRQKSTYAKGLLGVGCASDSFARLCKSFPVLKKRGVTEAQVCRLLVGQNGTSPKVIAALVEAALDDSVRSPVAVVPNRLEKIKPDRFVLEKATAALWPLRSRTVCHCGAPIKVFVAGTGKQSKTCGACSRVYPV